jgi:hypothetical protein
MVVAGGETPSMSSVLSGGKAEGTVVVCGQEGKGWYLASWCVEGSGTTSHSDGYCTEEATKESSRSGLAKAEMGQRPVGPHDGKIWKNEIWRCAGCQGTVGQIESGWPKRNRRLLEFLAIDLNLNSKLKFKLIVHIGPCGFWRIDDKKLEV